MVKLPIHKALLERNLMCGAFDVHVMAAKTSSGIEVLRPLITPVTQHHPHGAYIEREPAFQLEDHSAQAMLDALWEAGFRPSSGQGKQVATEQGVIAAMKEHMADLRRIAFAQMPDELRVTDDTPRTIAFQL